MTSPKTQQPTGKKKQPKKTKGIYLRGKTYWISYADATGKIQRHSTGQKNKEKAQKILDDRKKTVRDTKNGDTPDPGDVTKMQKEPFSRLCDEYETSTAMAQKCYATKKYHIKQLKGIFGETRITDLNLRMLDHLKSILQGVVPKQCPEGLEFIMKQRKVYLKKPAYSPAAINRLTSCYKHMMTKGADWGYGKDLPVRFKKLTKLKEIDRTDNYTEETCLSLINSARTTHHRIYVMIGLNAGPRNKEVMHLKWGDIDFTGMTITFQPGYTKSSDHRVNPLSAPLYSELRAWHDSLKKKPAPGDWLFADKKTGERIRSFRKAFGTMCRSVGIACRYHALRHTFASRLAGKRCHVKLIAELIGDSVETSMRYVHHDVSQKQGAVEDIGIGCEAGLKQLLESEAKKAKKRAERRKPGSRKSKR